ncbi:uncharacterized protein LOC131997871 [Stomoxys calcitrans]|uniref:uncharacterized protein LOC131997871 n=1 Tax=Stomoxys calcitrans TaxID=35570 RepID=UPI0027E2D2A9|nr:uncharacterized protein LOC131997871 [Stomoxys calcitrans]
MLLKTILNFLLFTLAFSKNLWVKCIMHQPDFGNFEYCKITKNTKNLTGLSFHLKLHQLPVTNCLAHVEFHYLTATRRPIVPVNSTWDACKFMANRKRFIAFEALFKIVGPATNLNHTCPYNHDIIGKNLVFDMDRIPFPVLPGQYIIKSSYFINNDKKLSINVGGRVI